MTASSLQETDIFKKKLLKKTELKALISKKDAIRINYNIISKQHENQLQLTFNKFDIANKEILKWVVDYYEKRLKKKKKNIRNSKRNLKKTIKRN